MEFQIDIDGYIGGMGYSKQFVRSKLEQYKDKQINVRINSLGGSLDDALDIAARFNAHGNVTTYLYGYCASAATIASLGAAKVVIDENAFYLVHKVMNWIDIWGLLNADDMQRTIDELEANKQDNQKMDLVLARMYAKKSGKQVADILNVLKKAAWLTANEALELGFVDEIGKGLSYNTPTIENKLNAFGLPLPTQKTQSKSFVNSIKNLFNNNLSMLKNFLNLNAILKTDGFEEKDNAVSLTTQQLTEIENCLKDNADKINSLSATISEKDATIANLQKQIEDLQNAAADTTKQVEPAENNVTANSLYNIVKKLI